MLGDLIHGRLGLTNSLRDTLRALPELCGCPILLIGGNHDRSSVIEGLPQHQAAGLERCGSATNRRHQQGMSLGRC